MYHPRKYVEAWEEIIKLASQIPNAKAVVFVPVIPEEQKNRYILMPDGTVETRNLATKKAIASVGCDRYRDSSSKEF
jgi:hypothetical protein